jgi:Outer membrane efflux protein
LPTIDLQTRRTELEQQGFRMRLAHNEQGPSVKLGPYTAGENVVDSKRELGLSLSMPLPFWNQARGSEEAAKARMNQAEVSLDTAMREVEQKIVTAADSIRKNLKNSAKTHPNSWGNFAMRPSSPTTITGLGYFLSPRTRRSSHNILKALTQS